MQNFSKSLCSSPTRACELVNTELTKFLLDEKAATTGLGTAWLGTSEEAGAGDGCQARAPQWCSVSGDRAAAARRAVRNSR
jgi:hypothetical protein